MTKEEMLHKIIQSNPAQDEIHSQIRTVSDILYPEEIINLPEWQDEFLAPDYRLSDMKESISSGIIVIYSSKPIMTGTFVTPSKMEAMAYAGNSTIYSKRINIYDVAWIDPLQGQYVG